jgi:hypothetical protein
VAKIETEALVAGLRGLFVTRRAVENVAPAVPGLNPTVDDDERHAPDDGDPDGSAIVRGVSVGLAIVHVDPEGRESTRRITVRRIYPDGDDFIIAAFCHERNAPRNFKLSKIRHVIDSKTGGVHADPRRYFMETALVPESGGIGVESVTREILRQCAPELAPLVYLGRADGQLGDMEVSVIADHVERFAADQGREITRAAVNDYARQLRPDYESCVDGLEEIVENRLDRVQAFVSSVEKVIDADGRRTPAEVEFLSELVMIFISHGIEMGNEIV